MDAARIVSQAIESVARGALAEAETLCRSVLASEPRHFRALVILGDVLARTERPDEALAAYEAALRRIPGHSTPYSKMAMLRFRMAFGPLHRRDPRRPVDLAFR
jgi:cytochrome c-type biogenesis protein CcmH/NrfG